MAAQRHSLDRAWHTDFSDPAEMASVRARVIGASAVLGIAAGLAGLAAAPHLTTRGWVNQVFTVTFLVLTILWSRRGRRIGDREFLVMILGQYAFATTSVVIGLGIGQVALTALSLSTVVLMGAVFCGTRRHVAYQALFGIAALFLTQQWPADSPIAATMLSTAAFNVIVTSFVVRLLKDLAVTALARAKRGEVTDPMTGLANRRGLERFGAQRWAARARLRLPLAVLVVDVDHFKRINDAYGHAAGDELLRRLAAVLLDVVRVDDVAVRLGGEEFLVLASLPEGHGELAAERLRTAIEQQLSPVTVSIGVHEVLPEASVEMPAALWAAVAAADRALYSAKNQGRNRVVATAPAPA